MIAPAPWRPRMEAELRHQASRTPLGYRAQLLKAALADLSDCESEEDAEACVLWWGDWFLAVARDPMPEVVERALSGEAEPDEV